MRARRDAPASCPPATRAFTLIEVLVVVSIIALLAAILLPSLQQARAQAHSARCKAYVRQLGTGMTIYLQQYDAFPAHQWKLGETNDLRIRWFNAMLRSLKTKDVQSCPLTEDWHPGQRNNAYGYNYKYLGSARVNLVSPTAPWERFPVKFVRQPSRTIAFGDSDGTGWEKPHVNGDWGADGVYVDVKDKQMIGNHGYTLDPTYIPTHSLQTEEEAYAWKNYRTYTSTRHLGGANLCFADGHVEAMKPEQIYQDNRYWNGYGGEVPEHDDHVPYKFHPGLDIGWRFPDIPH